MITMNLNINNKLIAWLKNLWRKPTLSLGNAAPPDTKYLYYPQCMEGVTLRGSLLPACRIQNNNQSKLKYSYKFNCINLLLIKKLTLFVGDPGPQMQRICIIPGPWDPGGPIDTRLHQLTKIAVSLGIHIA